MSEIFADIILPLGSLAGYISSFYLLWKRLRKGIRVYPISGTYGTIPSESEKLFHIKSTIQIGFLNHSDQTISITDIIGTIRYNKELYDKEFSSINTSTPPEVYSERPTNFHDAVNFSVPPHETIRKTIVIVFPNMFPDLVDRIGLAHFAGFLRGKTPLLNVYETELKEQWSAHPLDLLLSVHIDGKRIYDVQVSLFRIGDQSMSGTLNVIDIERVKQDFREEGARKAHYRLAPSESKRKQE